MTNKYDVPLLKPHRPSTKKDYFITDINNSNKIVVHGYGLLKKYKDLEPVIFERRAPYSNDVVIEILYAGVCHSDWHNIIGEWESELPLVPGHEIVGKVVRRGSAVTKFHIGDIVAVGPYVSTCLQCAMCQTNHEQYCENQASWTYNGTDRKPGDIVPTGEPTYGGFSTFITVNEDFVFGVPKNLPIENSAPLLCAGITTYSPLKQSKIGPGKKVGIAGIGGLGHMAIKLAKAMGAHVVALTTTKWKLKDSRRIGADESVLVTDPKQMEKISESLDLIIDTIPKVHNLNPYLDLLAFNGTLWIVGVFEFLDFDMNSLAGKNRSLKSSIIGGRSEIEELLNFCSKHNIFADVELIDIKNINKTYNKLLKSEVKYRFVIKF